MKTWAYVAGAAAAVSAAVVVTLVLRRSGSAGVGEQIPRIIADCQDRVDRIERELHKLRSSAAN